MSFGVEFRRYCVFRTNRKKVPNFQFAVVTHPARYSKSSVFSLESKTRILSSPKRAINTSHLYFYQQILRMVLLELFSIFIAHSRSIFIHDCSDTRVCMYIGLPKKLLYGHFSSLQRVFPQTRFLNSYK